MRTRNSSTERTYCKNWGPFSGAAKAVVRKELDGFFVPHAGGFKIPETWDGKLEVVKYRNLEGTLVLRKDAYKLYGFEKETDFARAVKKRSVPCKTVNGVLTLGKARKAKYDGRKLPLTGVISLIDFPFNLEFPLKPEEEYDFIEKAKHIFPKSNVSVSENPLVAEASNTWSSFRKGMKVEKSGKLESKNLHLLICGVGASMAAISPIMLNVSGWFTPISLVVCMLIMHIYFKRIVQERSCR